MAGSGSGRVSQGYRFADPDPYLPKCHGYEHDTLLKRASFTIVVTYVSLEFCECQPFHLLAGSLSVLAI
jgi:hypothetical protein